MHLQSVKKAHSYHQPGKQLTTTRPQQLHASTLTRHTTKQTICRIPFPKQASNNLGTLLLLLSRNPPPCHRTSPLSYPLTQPRDYLGPSQHRKATLVTMSASTKTGGDPPIIISMGPATTIATTIVTTMDATPTTPTDLETFPIVTRPDPATIVPSTIYAGTTTSTTETGDDKSSSVIPTTSHSTTPAPASSSSLQTTLFSSSSDAALSSSIALPSITAEPDRGLSVPASIGLGVSTGVIAICVIASVLWAVYGRSLKNMWRNFGRGAGGTDGRRWWKRARRDSF